MVREAWTRAARARSDSGPAGFLTAPAVRPSPAERVTTWPAVSASPKTAARRAVMARTGNEWLRERRSSSASGLTASAACTRIATPPPPETATKRPRLNSETARSTASRETGSRVAGIDNNSKELFSMALIIMFFLPPHRRFITREDLRPLY